MLLLGVVCMGLWCVCSGLGSELAHSGGCCSDVVDILVALPLLSGKIAVWVLAEYRACWLLQDTEL